MPRPTRPRRWRGALAVAALALSAVVVSTGPTQAQSPVQQITSQITVAGQAFSAANHLVTDLDNDAGEYLVVWAGDLNLGDNTANGLVDRLSTVDLNTERLLNVEAPDYAPGNDFLAVVNADPTSSQYGRVVNTVTLSPMLENEPHHLQYVWHKGQRIYAGGLYSDMTYVFDVTELPLVKLTGVNLPSDTPCGSVPDAYWVLNDGTAYGTYMGGPDVAGPCLYTNGETRVGNGFAGTPGSLVRIGPDGRTMAEVPADTESPVDRDPVRCPGVPTTTPSCANPHGIQVREDLDRMVTSDYAEPKNVPISDPYKPASAHLFRDTVRVWDISDRNNPRVVNVSAMPDGPRRERNPGHEEPRGIMETTVTNLPQHRGAFASSMCGGVIYYTPDITAPTLQWREVFDDTTASSSINPNVGEGAGCDGGGWVQTSGDDRYLYHAVIGRNPGALGPSDTGSAKMVYVLDIQKLLAAGNSPACNIDTINEVASGGAEADCPRLIDALEIPDTTSGGPHWGALDNFERRRDGTYVETAREKRLAVSNYFVSRSGVDGNHKVCMVNVANDGTLSFDSKFIDENEGSMCVDFNRTVWPHGRAGGAKPHSQLFVVRNDRLADGRASVTTASTGKAGAPAAPAAAAPASRPAAASGATPAPAAPVDSALNVTSSPASSSRTPTRPVPWPAAGAAAVLIAAVGIGIRRAARSMGRSGG